MGNQNVKLPGVKLSAIASLLDRSDTVSNLDMTSQCFIYRPPALPAITYRGSPTLSAVTEWWLSPDNHHFWSSLHRGRRRNRTGWDETGLARDENTETRTLRGATRTRSIFISGKTSPAYFRCGLDLSK